MVPERVRTAQAAALRHLRDGETFTVCDLFDSEAPDDSNQAEMNGSYASLTRTAFEANYRAFHDGLPRIVQAPTSVILDHVRPESCRFGSTTHPAGRSAAGWRRRSAPTTAARRRRISSWPRAART